MIQEKRMRLAVLLLQGLTIDEFAELTTLLKEERQEWFDKEVKKLNLPVVVGQSEQLCPKCSGRIEEYYAGKWYCVDCNTQVHRA